MGSGLTTNNPLVVSAFHSALRHQGLVALGLLAVVAVAWSILRSVRLSRAMKPLTGPAQSADGAGEAAPGGAGGEGGDVRAAGAGGPAGAGGAGGAGGAEPRSSLSSSARSSPSPEPSPAPEPAARRLLRISFGLLWILDGVLQGQAAMPLGLVSQVIQPTTSASPSWVRHVVNAGTNVWSYHPVSAAAAAVWIQVGIGLWLLVAPRGNWSRLGGVASAGWALVVWVFGETFGGVFAPGLSWLFGAPGAVLFYAVAGGLIALPEEAWFSARTGRRVVRGMGLFFIGMAVLQAWPGRGFWQGGPSGGSRAPGSLLAMVRQMSATPQPSLLQSSVRSFASFDAAHGWAVNLFAVVALAAIGAAFVSGRERLVKYGLIAGIGLCLADWVLVQDLGFLGGVGTDPNSMIPMALVFVAGYVGMVRTRAPADALAGETEPLPVGWRARLMANPTYAFRLVAAAAAAGVVLLGAVPMAAAAANRNADTIIATATAGAPNSVDSPAPGFNLIDQNGQPVSLADLRGKVVALTFLDPVCTTDCPVIAQEFKTAGKLLGPDSKKVELLAIDANPRYIETAFLDAFDQQENLSGIPNWRYLSGTLPQLEAVWKAYGVTVSYEPGGGMVDHNDVAFVIDARGQVRYALSTDPGSGSGASRSSFAQTIAGLVRHTIQSS
jgi:cytochrome oxidase Cu insertion factor (SCO1/SenC/PrrC family)